jgi:N-sulfoglucosamine sulfohydrolase
MAEARLAGSRPNIIMVIVHDLGQYLGCYGAPIRTPHLDAMAREGVTFTNQFCSAASCSPSRGSIITGRYPHRNGLTGLAHLGWQLGGQEVTLPMYLNAAGYDTHLVGLQHEHAEARRLGYQQVDEAHGDARTCAEKVVRFLEDRAGHRAEQPFYVNTGWFEPHRPYDAPGYDRDDPGEVTPLPWLPDRPGIREDLAGLNGLVYRVDECLGTMREALARTGLGEDTLLIFTTDHGLAMPRAKGTCYDPGLKTALVMDWPGHLTGGSRQGELLANCDLVPTLLDLAGQRVPETLDGRSFLALLTGDAYERRDSIFAEMTWHDQYNPMRAVRTERYKYLRNFGDRPLVFIPLDIYRAPAGQEMKAEYYASRRPAEELYDLEADPLEQCNLAADPGQAGVLGELRRRVDDWMVQTNDFLLYGDSPASQALLERWEKERWDNG